MSAEGVFLKMAVGGRPTDRFVQIRVSAQIYNGLQDICEDRKATLQAVGLDALSTFVARELAKIAKRKPRPRMPIEASPVAQVEAGVAEL